MQNTHFPPPKRSYWKLGVCFLCKKCHKNNFGSFWPKVEVKSAVIYREQNNEQAHLLLSYSFTYCKKTCSFSFFPLKTKCVLYSGGCCARENTGFYQLHFSSSTNLYLKASDYRVPLEDALPKHVRYISCPKKLTIRQS